LSTYDELLERVKAIAQAHQFKAKEYIPKMYWALRNENSNVTPEDARDRIQKDCVGIWGKRTLLNAIPDEAKDPKKQKAGRLRQKETNSAALIAASSDNKEAILLESNGREKIHPPEDKEIKYIEDDENSHYNSKLKTMKGCRNCLVLQERNETLINKIEDYEQVIKEISQIRTADTISSEINDGIQGVAFNRNVENNPTHFDEVLNINHYFSWPELQKYMQELFRSGKALKVWFNLRVEKKTGTVLEAHLGCSTIEDNNA
jgi:hypothetical protein